MDRLARAHRWLGFATIWLIGGHIVLTVTGYAMGDGQGVIAELVTLVWTYPFVLWAVVGFLLFVMLGITSVRASRRRLSYETWYFLHLYAYLAIALAFLHQLFVGADFIHDQLAAIYWISPVRADGGAGPRLPGRPAAASPRLRHRLRVSAVVPEAPGVVSIYLAGRDLDRLAVRSGQYFVVRFLTRDGWWRGHPFSLSSAPNGALAPDHGQGARRRQPAASSGSRSGTAVFVEGPYGVLTGARRTRRQGDAHRRRHRHRPAARPPGVAGGAARRADAALPRPLTRRTSCSAGSWTSLPQHRGATVHYLLGRRRPRRVGRPARAHGDRPPRPGRRRAGRLPVRADGHDARRRGSPARAGRARGARSTPSGSPTDAGQPSSAGAAERRRRAGLATGPSRSRPPTLSRRSHPAGTVRSVPRMGKTRPAACMRYP